MLTSLPTRVFTLVALDVLELDVLDVLVALDVLEFLFNK
jgi:hypothetical protein